MDFVGTKVKHKKYGEGAISSCDGRFVAVKFSAKETKFQFPQCFENFLEVIDETKKAAIIKVIEEDNYKKQQEKIAKDVKQQKIENNLKIYTKKPSTSEIQVAISKSNTIEGNVFQIDTHVNFLNKVFGTSYNKWMKSTWPYSDNIVVWMVRFYGEVDGWKNRFYGDKIIEEYFGKKDINEPAEPYKIAVSIDDRGFKRTYTILGLFKISREESNARRRIYYKVEN